MPDEHVATPLDYGLIEPISLPADSRIPDVHPPRSTAAEYDGYFRITRKSLDLHEWSATCLQVQERVLTDLAGTDLTLAEREHLLRGFLTLNTVTLRRWISSAATAPEPGT